MIFVVFPVNYNYAQRVLMSQLDNYRQHSEKNNVIAGVFIDLSKAFDCVPNNFWLTKLKERRKFNRLVQSY